MPRTAAEISTIMRQVKGRDTSVERRFRRALFAHGLRYKICDDALPGKPDVVLPGRRLVIFIDGDYWHGHQWRRRGLTCLEEQFPADSENRDYWIRKITRNMLRDFAATRRLVENGWRVLRFWESDLEDDFEGCVAEAVGGSRSTTRYESTHSESARLIPALTVAEFFAGIGLVRLGLSPPWNIVFANDIDAKKQQMYAANFGDDHFRLGDIHALAADDLPDCTLFTASFPCNDLSLAGGRKGLAGKESSAFFGVTRLLQELGPRKPPLVLLENVPGFLTSHRGNDLKTALATLGALGYTVDLFQLNAASFTPQSRPRLFIVGVLEQMAPDASFRRHARDEVSHDYGAWKLPATAVRPQPLVDFIFTHPDLPWNIRPLPDPPPPAHRLEGILEDLPAGHSHWWNDERAEYFMNQLSDRHAAWAAEMMGGDTYAYATAFRRVRQGRSMAELRIDGLAGCLRTPRGGSGRQILLKAGRGEFHVRLLTPRECARLQGVRDDYKIPVPDNQALFGFGDAVCVPAIRWISDKYLLPVAAEMMRGTVLT